MNAKVGNQNNTTSLRGRRCRNENYPNYLKNARLVMLVIYSYNSLVNEGLLSQILGASLEEDFSHQSLQVLH